MTRKSIWYLAVSLLILSSCGNDPLDIDASNVEVDIVFTDINTIIMEADSTELIKQHNLLFDEKQDIYSYLIGYCMSIGNVPDTAFYNSIMLFRADSTIQSLAKHIKLNFLDRTDMEANIIDAFKHLKFHLPTANIPTDIVYLNSLYRSGVFCTETEIGIGLEQFLGADNDVIKKLNAQVYYDWMKKGMEPEFLERDVLTGWIETHCVDDLDGSLAEHMIRWGKIIYLTEAAYPDVSEHIIMRYTEADYTWATENEAAFWEYLVTEKLLFTSDDRTIRNMVGDGPFTPGLPEENDTDRLGQYLGWRMVHKYMEKNEVTVEEMVNTPYNSILQEYEVE
ncbi:MAG: hypothetical protein QNK23_09600 [Crocinitomicaceae bacterium]|nr:hypothetical protein [Crocinitomicaceae bacterium]